MDITIAVVVIFSLLTLYVINRVSRKISSQIMEVLETLNDINENIDKTNADHKSCFDEIMKKIDELQKHEIVATDTILKGNLTVDGNVSVKGNVSAFVDEE